MRMRRGIAIVLAVAAGAGVARADEVTGQIDRALQAYRRHDVAGAMLALDNAAALLRRQRLEAMRALLPAAPDGWTGDAPRSTDAETAMLGAGTSVAGSYRNGAQVVRVQITADSPLLEEAAMLVNSPLAASAGIRSVRVAGHPAAYTESDNGYIALVAGKVIVKVDGDGTVPEPVLYGFMTVMDFAGIARLVEPPAAKPQHPPAKKARRSTR